MLFRCFNGRRRDGVILGRKITPLMPFIYHRLFNRSKSACIGDKFPERDLSNGLGCHYIPFYGSINELTEERVDETNSSAVDI
ncbi:hypothetical protein TNCV_73081 [Trichonephila clavipes]|uniref:Uncharacterized protein n=1 Tax=Trichonephila clavipes TaxID=2585209 RepID=A0A8X6R7M8_TRICX|nr:hypothetical protein TNCV_73081 [Trichonephila clavipes]